MPIYVYECLTCRGEAESVKGSALTDEELPEVLFETRHRMNPTEAELVEAVQCPKCHGGDCKKSYHGTSLTCWVRGYGYLDKSGRNRDMNVYKLENDDPYGHMREPGEAADLKLKLQRSGKHNPKPKYFVQTESQSAMKAAVEKAVKSE